MGDNRPVFLNKPIRQGGVSFTRKDKNWNHPIFWDDREVEDKFFEDFDWLIPEMSDDEEPVPQPPPKRLKASPRNGSNVNSFV